FVLEVVGLSTLDRVVKSYRARFCPCSSMSGALRKSRETRSPEPKGERSRFLCTELSQQTPYDLETRSRGACTRTRCALVWLSRHRSPEGLAFFGQRRREGAR